jgi:hypothetical protein
MTVPPRCCLRLPTAGASALPGLARRLRRGLDEWTTRAQTRDGRCYESDYAGVFQVVDGHLAAVTEYLGTAYAMQVLFSS